MLRLTMGHLTGTMQYTVAMFASFIPLQECVIFVYLSILLFMSYLRQTCNVCLICKFCGMYDSSCREIF